MKKTDKINELKVEMENKINEIIRMEKEVKGFSCITYAAKAEIAKVREEYTAKIIVVERQGKKPMSKTVLRVFDKNEGLQGKCYFLVIEKDSEIENAIEKIANMNWQNYNAYAVGIAELYKDELYYSEIMEYNSFEVKIDVERVQNLKVFELAR